jgi:hypothetical protein
MAYAKAEREALTRLQNSMHRLLNTAKAGNRGFSPEERTSYDRMIVDHSKLELQIKQVEAGNNRGPAIAEGGYLLDFPETLHH